MKLFRAALLATLLLAVIAATGASSETVFMDLQWGDPIAKLGPVVEPGTTMAAIQREQLEELSLTMALEQSAFESVPILDRNISFIRHFASGWGEHLLGNQLYPDTVKVAVLEQEAGMR